MDKKNVELVLKQNEEMIYPYIWIAGDETNITISAKLIGDNSSLVVCGVFLGDDKHEISFNTRVEHVGRNTRSLTTMRGVFKDASSFSNDGLIAIKRGAKNTDGYFQSKILLFDNARGRSVPSLEIDENEVKAGHGSTVGRPDPMQLFYLRSRGLTEKEAEKLIVLGFFDPILNYLPLEIQKETAKLIQIKLATL